MPASLTFAIPDLHGRHDLLCKALTTIEGMVSSGTVVFLGDYIDRGPDSKQVLDRLMEGPPDGWRWVILKGNHEDIMRQALVSQHHMQWWIRNGGGPTLASFGLHPGSVLDTASTTHIVPYSQWCDRLPLCYIDDHRVFVHAGLKEDVTLAEQPEDFMLWHRYGIDEGWGTHSGRHVVHGHQASRLGAVRYAGRTNLDGMAYDTGNLFVGVFDDATPGGPVRILEIKNALSERSSSLSIEPYVIGDLAPLPGLPNRSFWWHNPLMGDRAQRDLTQRQVEEAQAMLARAKARRINALIELKEIETLIADNEALLTRARREQEVRDKSITRV